MSRRTTMLLAFVFMFGILQVGPEGAQAQQTYTLRGQTCSADYTDHDHAPIGFDCRGGPLAGATLTATPQSSPALGIGAKTTTSNGDGAFSFDGLAAGSYTVRAERSGFEPTEVQVEIPRDKPLGMSLTGKTVTVKGEVVGPDGPVSGAKVGFYQSASTSATTGQGGAFTTQLRAGWYEVEINHPEFRRLGDYLFVDGSETLRFQLTAAPERTAALAGVVRDQDGQPVADAFVEVHQWGGDCCYEEPRPMPAGSGGDEQASTSVAYPYYDDGYQTTRTTADGSFRLAVYAGSGQITISKEGHARASSFFEVGDGDTETREYELRKFPDKTARIEGRITGPGGNAQWTSISIENPEFGVYECSVNEPHGQSGEVEEGRTEPAMTMPDYEHRCAITVHADGTFEGTVTPGYSILRAYFQHWRTCTETSDSSGHYSRSCGQDFFPHVKVLDLPADATTKHDVALTARPGPDATVSGYAVDVETGKAVPGAHISFSNQDRHGWAWTNTDGDGSYKVQIRSGYLMVHVWADGYLPWEGVLRLSPGTTSYDIPLTPGEAYYGGCCYAYAEPRAVAAGDSMEAGPSSGDRVAAGGAGAPFAEDGGSDGGSDFVDLGGGLGPYNAAKRGTPGEAEATPAPAILLVMAALIGIALRSRQSS